MSEDLSAEHQETIHTPAKNPEQDREDLWLQIEANRAAIRQALDQAERTAALLRSALALSLQWGGPTDDN